MYRKGGGGHICWPKYISDSSLDGGGLKVKEKDPSDLQSQKVIHSTDDDIDGGGAASLCPQVVLEI